MFRCHISLPSTTIYTAMSIYFKPPSRESHRFIIPISKSINQSSSGNQSLHINFLYKHIHTQSLHHSLQGSGEGGRMQLETRENRLLQRHGITFWWMISINLERSGTAEVLQLWSKPLPSFSLLHNTGPSFIATFLKKQVSFPQIST